VGIREFFEGWTLMDVLAPSECIETLHDRA
jgi:hypothetical protein